MRRMTFLKDLMDRRLTLPTALLVFYSIPISMTVPVLSRVVRAMFTPSCESDQNFLFISITVEVFLLCFSYPVAGWVVDVIVGRDSSMAVSLLSAWIGILLEVVSCTLQYYSFGIPTLYARYCISGISLIFILFGIVTFFSLILSYGMDQLIYESSAKMRAFVHWIAWGIFAGHFMNYLTFTACNQLLTIGTSVSIFGLLTVSLILHIFLKDTFMPSGKVRDSSYKVVIWVLRYALSNEYPRNRSAYSYWEQDQPSRIDIAKFKYGGPFSEDSVENTKTFVKVTLLLLASFGIYMPYTIVHNIFPTAMQYESTLQGYGMPILYASSSQLILIMVPIFELIIIPFYSKVEFFLAKPLNLIILSNAFMIITLIIMIVLQVTSEYVYDDTPEKCLFALCYNEYTASYLWYVLVFVFAGITSAVNIIGMFGFICSQAPSSLIGMLTASFWFIRGIYIMVGSTSPILFSYTDWEMWELGDSFLIACIQLIISILGFIVLLVGCRRYKTTVSRVNSLTSHVIIENHFEKILCSSSETACEDDILEIVHVPEQQKSASTHSIQNELMFTAD